jgi:hypothetical protein
MMTLFEVTREIAARLYRIFLEDESGRRTVFGGEEQLQTDPRRRDNFLLGLHASATQQPWGYITSGIFAASSYLIAERILFSI